MTSITVILFVMSAVLIAMTCVRADRVRSWREAVNPTAPEVPDSAFTAARVTFLVMAAFGIYYGFQSISLADSTAWSDGELTSAVSGATDALDGVTAYADPHENAPVDFDGEYALRIRDEVVAHGGADAPDWGVDAALTGPDASDEAYYTITADGAATAFCLHVTIRRDKSSDYEAPGIAGKTWPQRAYTFTATSHEDEC
ncbi:hypothetical protein [Streptomyces sp. NRRL S-31]|uniref:hypothetical protein n=1 Tax=Streptomyces sp. NRRL S-31 TaxID=1463898 RepID=UPI0004CBAF9A|nr:hypothetical protein [Streptomyces sp. NRRL S-31]